MFIPVALSFNVDLSCPNQVQANSPVDCDVVLSNVAQGDVTFEFKVQVPQGFTETMPPTPQGAINWNGINNKAVVFNLQGLENGVLGKLHLTASNQGGLVTLIDVVDGNNNQINVRGTNVQVLSGSNKVNVQNTKRQVDTQVTLENDSESFVEKYLLFIIAGVVFVIVIILIVVFMGRKKDGSQGSDNSFSETIQTP